MAGTGKVVAVALFCVTAHAQSLQLSQTSLTFAGYAGGDAAAPQSIIVTSTTRTPVRFTVSSDNSPWITFSPSRAVTPARISVSVDPSALAAAGYQTRILISDPSAVYGPIVVPVSFTVDSRPPALDVFPNAVRLGDRDQVDTVYVRNAGGGGRFAFRVSLLSSSPWVVSVNPDQGVVGPNSPVPVRVRVSDDGLDPGAYRAVLRFTSQAGSEDIPIAFFVGGPGASIGTQPRGFVIDLRQDAPVSLTRRVAIQNRGNGLLNWTADLVEGSQYVKLTSSSGLSTPANPSFLTFSIQNDGLAAGPYYALVRVSTPGARNTPQLIPIVLFVRDPAVPPRPDLSPAGLTFVAVAGQAPPPPQIVEVDANSARPVAYQASASTGDGLGWLPFSGTGVSSGQRSGQTAIAVNHAGLAPGVYTGEVAYSFSNADASAVGVTLVVLPAGAKLAAATGCTPARLTMTQSDLVSNFSIPAGWPTPLTIRLTDDCGSPVLNGQVVLTFSNGDPALAMSLSDPRDGSYSATWVPTRNGASVAVTARAAAIGLSQAAAALTGAVFPNKAPILFEDATVNQFNAVKGAALAPGTMVSIIGSGLAAATKPAGVVPLPTNVGGTRVLVGGIEAPLFAVSDGEITAQIPVELATNRQYQVLVAANGAFTVPDTIALTAVQPGLHVSSEDSRVVAQHSDSTPIGAETPAAPGEEIVLYLTGMGLTDPQVGSGAAAPTDSLSRALSTPAVTVDGAPAEVVFAGLTPGAVGLYQINLRVPADARTGDLAVAITQGGVQCNPGVVPVRQTM